MRPRSTISFGLASSLNNGFHGALNSSQSLSVMGETKSPH